MRYLTITEAAAFYGVAPKTLRKLARRGELQAVKIGSRWRFLAPAGGAA